MEVRLGVRAQRLHELRLAEVPVGDEQLAQATLVGLLLEQGPEERLLGDQAVAHEGLADRLARVVGARPLHGAVAEGQPLLRGAAGHLRGCPPSSAP